MIRKKITVERRAKDIRQALEKEFEGKGLMFSFRVYEDYVMFEIKTKENSPLRRKYPLYSHKEMLFESDLFKKDAEKAAIRDVKGILSILEGEK